ncbi:hypothetical protein DXV76_05790 [Rhodobacteraceae bacterium CCMM004]|nr:hypothetical protein DXV76_05790 [Rhodobacteraceae bacterium CCMM004]
MQRFIILASSLIVAACNTAAPNQCTPTADEIRSWTEARTAGSRAAYRAFLQQYPDGCYASRATRALEGRVSEREVRAIGGGGGGNGSGPGPSTPY